MQSPASVQYRSSYCFTIFLRLSIVRSIWARNVKGAKGALDYIAAIDKKYIKSQESLDSLRGYIMRKQENIPCYAIRKGLGLHNSSNPVEKANDIIVAHRQKGKERKWHGPRRAVMHWRLLP